MTPTLLENFAFIRVGDNRVKFNIESSRKGFILSIFYKNEPISSKIGITEPPSFSFNLRQIHDQKTFYKYYSLQNSSKLQTECLFIQTNSTKWIIYLDDVFFISSKLTTIYP